MTLKLALFSDIECLLVQNILYAAVHPILADGYE